MILLFLILLIFALSSIRPLQEGDGGYNPEYISKDTANVIKGICIWLVFIRHISQYMVNIPALNFSDNLLFDADSYIRQLLVVPFLFYSGFGVTHAIRNRGEAYANKIPTKRVLPTLRNFDIAVVFFLLMNIALGYELDLTRVLLAFTGWESIRNSNWYIFCILICYMLSWISFKLCAKKSKSMMLGVLFVGILLYTAILYFFKGHWWYDTVYAYAAGAVYASYKTQFEGAIKRHYSFVFAFALIGFVVFYNAPNYFSVAADITAVFLSFIIVLMTFKVRLRSNVLAWSGRNLFPLYIYQRLPMVVLSTVCGGAFMNNHPYAYIVCSLIITVLIAFLYSRINCSVYLSNAASCLRRT